MSWVTKHRIADQIKKLRKVAHERSVSYWVTATASGVEAFARKRIYLEPNSCGDVYSNFEEVRFGPSPRTVTIDEVIICKSDSDPPILRGAAGFDGRPRVLATGDDLLFRVGSIRISGKLP